MQDIVIVCAGNYGREVYWCLQSNNEEMIQRGKEPAYNIIGFIDDNIHALDGYSLKIPILGKISEWKPIAHEKYALGVGTPKTKKRVTDILKARGCSFINVISSLALISPDIQIGEGCLITMGSIVSSGVTCGDFVNINGSMICGGSTIESYSTTTGYSVVEAAVLHQGVFIGSKAVITQECEIGNWSQVAAGSVVVDNVRPNVTVFGMPAQEIG